MNFNAVNNITFGTTSRTYNSELTTRPIGCNTWFYRDDINWKNFAKYEVDHFKDKDNVDIIMFASSDGSEAYTKIMSLLERVGSEKAKKFFPIKAYDLDETIVSLAKSGTVKTVLADRKNICKYTKNCSDYFAVSPDKKEIMNDKTYRSEIFFSVKDSLSKNVNFNIGDMFKKISEVKDNSNTILMCRNVLGYFWNSEVEKFIRMASSVLKEGSLFAVGEYDSVIHDNIKSLMKKHGFKKVMDNVYKKV